MKMNSSYISASAARKRLCFRLAPMIAIATVIATGQDCPPGGGGEATCYVQYRTATANKSKCQFQEFTEFQVPPRLRMYLKQTSIRQSDEFSSGGVGYGPNCTMTNEAGFNLKTNWLNILETETITTERTTCMSTGVYSGSYHQGEQIDDSRFVLCDNGPCEHYRTYYHHRWSLDQSVQYTYHNGQMQWVWVGNDNTQTSSDGWEDCDGTVTWDGTNSTTIPFTNLYIFGIPPVTPVSATHAVWMPDPPVSGHSASVQLEEEYTDANLYSDIMGRMPAYADGWYTPGPYDPLLYRSAYSLIHMNHTTGPFGGWGFNAPGAELQKMQYRFCVPQSGRKTAYYITWDIITYNFSTGVWTRDSANTTVVGTGGTDDACSAEFYAAPPDWDQSNYHGFVIRWVDNVKVTITTRSPEPKKPVPGKGSLGGTTLGEGNDCRGCGGKVGLIGALESGGIQLGFSMGQASNGISAESLNIRSALPNLNLASPAGLSYTAFDPSIEVIQASGLIRQVKSPEALADIITLSAFAYEIRYYLPSQVGSQSGGVYQVTGNPFVTWKVENPDASTNTFNRLRVSETRGSDVKSYDYTYTAAANKWTLDYPGNLRQDEWTAAITTNAPPIYMAGTAQGGSFPAFYRTVTNMVRQPGGPDLYKVRRVYRQFRWGESLIEETISPEADPKTTTYAYDEVYGYGNATIQPLKLVTHPDGSWKYYERDGSGRITATYSGFGDTPAPTSGTPNPALCRKTEYDYNALSSSGDDGSSFYYVPRTTVEYAKGSEVSRHYTIILPGERRDIRCQSPSVWWDASDNLVTITKYYTSGVNTNRVQSIERPDRTMTIVEYAQAVNGSQTNTVYTGQPNGSKTAITNGTKEVTILGPLSEMISRTVTDIASTILLSADTYSNYDEFNRPTRVTHLDGTYEDTIYACCGLDSTIDRDGVITQYHIDTIVRPT